MKNSPFKSEKIRIPSTGRDISLLIVRPAVPASGPVPGILWIHGGGHFTGMPEMVYKSRAADLIKKFGAVVVAPDYRLCGEAPYPADLEDCYSALVYMKEHAQELGFRPDQLMVGGESAGGGLTVALCLMAKRRGEVNIAFQMPLYPMLDDRETPSSRNNHAPIWNTRKNRKAWKDYLRDISGPVPDTAAPARCEDYSGLPPAYTFVGSAEPFYCETLSYVSRLRQDGVEARVDVYPGLFHAFDIMLPFLPASGRAAKKFEQEFSYALKNFFAPQN